VREITARASGRRLRPAAVSCAWRVSRSNNSTSKALSSALIAWLMADCARLSFRAAPEKLPWSHTATNARSWLMVTLSSTFIQ